MGVEVIRLVWTWKIFIVDTSNDEGAKVASEELDESVRYKRTTVKAVETFPSFEMESTSIETMYSLAMTHLVKIPAHDQVKLDDLRVAMKPRQGVGRRENLLGYTRRSKHRDFKVRIRKFREKQRGNV